MTSKKKSSFHEYTEAIIIALILALFIRTFVVQAFKIPSGSMLETLQIGDHLLVTKFIYGVKNPFTGATWISYKTPQPNDIIVFKFPKDPKLDYIKRVIAVEGQTIEIRNKKVYVDGEAFDDAFGEFKDTNILAASVSPRDNYGPSTVPAGHVFVMGDNRDNSYDSRFWGFVDVKDIRGKTLILYWSWDLDRPLTSAQRFTSIRWERIGKTIR